VRGTHFSSQVPPPSIFAQYIEPYYRDFSALIHARSTLSILHADDYSRAILRNIERAGCDMVECFATFPMVPTTRAEARAARGNRVII
jgi:hypothetical protein